MQLKYISFAVALIVAYSTQVSKASGILGDGETKPIPQVSLCDLVANLKQYQGQTVTTTARIFSGKHVTVLLDPTCRRKGSDLHFPVSGTESASVLELEKALDQHGMGDHPIIATLTGKWLGTRYYEHQFITQPRIVFEVTVAKDIMRSKKTEPPY